MPLFLLLKDFNGHVADLTLSFFLAIVVGKRFSSIAIMTYIF